MERHLVDKQIYWPLCKIIELNERLRLECAVLFEPEHQSARGGCCLKRGALQGNGFSRASGASQNEHKWSGGGFVFEKHLEHKVFFDPPAHIETLYYSSPTRVVSFIEALRKLLPVRHTQMNKGEVGRKRDP